VDEPKKRGRKPIGERRMTEAEKKRRQRELKAKSGIKQAFFSVEGELVDRIDRVVEFFELSGRTEAVQGLLKNPLNDMLTQLGDFQRELEGLFGLLESKDPSPELRAVIRTEKQKYWLAITNPDRLLKPTKQSDTASRTSEKGNNND
jgi:hypothetical protein